VRSLAQSTRIGNVARKLRAPPPRPVATSRRSVTARGVCLLHSRRRGVTLLELLVVMLILLMVTAAAIPIVVPAMQNRRMRESARLVSSYFATARSRAIETGRPVGVVIERFNGQPFGMLLSQVEVPPPYAGDFVNSRIAIDNTTNAKITDFVTGDSLWKGLVTYGDQVELDYRGPTYVLASIPGVVSGFVDPKAGNAVPDAPGVVNWYLVTQTGQIPSNIPAAYLTGGVPFQIIRQPTRSSTAPLQLPEGIVVDLASSGMGTGLGPTGTFMDLASSYGGPSFMTGSVPTLGPIVRFDPVIMFSPSGGLEAVSQGPAGIPARPTDAVFLLMGRRELMFDATQRNQPFDVVDQNLSPIPATGATYTDSTTWPTPPPHFWISIGYQTGLVSVAELAPNLQEYAPTTSKPMTRVITDALWNDPPVPPGDLRGARMFAHQSQSTGG
jgi:prepilin-type N-terminal cleavage/methylation domain-containing protein